MRSIAHSKTLLEPTSQSFLNLLSSFLRRVSNYSDIRGVKERRLKREERKKKIEKGRMRKRRGLDTIDRPQ